MVHGRLWIRSIMGYMLLLAAFLFVQSSYGYHPESAPPEKFKLTAPHTPYFPDHKSESSNHKPGPPDDDTETKYVADSKEHSTEQYDFYTPHKDFHSSDSSGDDFEGDSYIPHSKKFSKYLKSSENSSPDEKHTHWEDDEYLHGKDNKKSEDVPRYGYVSNKDHHSNHKNDESDTENLPKSYDHDEWIKKHPLPYKHEPKYIPHSHEKPEEHKLYEHSEKKYEIHPSHYEEPDKYEDKSHLRYQHWSDKGAGAFPVHNTEKLIEEIGKSKSHHYNEPEKSLDSSIPSAFNHAKHPPLHEEKASYVPPIEKFIKEHDIHNYKSPHQTDGGISHLRKHKHIEGPVKRPHFPKHYPHINKYHNEQHVKSFRYFKPQLNFGGHHYDWMYKPKSDFYKEMQKDLDLKIRLLKEHEDKLAQLQKGHLEKYRALFKPHYTGKFFYHKQPKNGISNFEPKHHSYSDHHIPKFDVPKFEALHSLSKQSLGYNNYPKESDHSDGDPDHHSHYEIPHSKHEEEHSSHKPHHHLHYETHHSKHEEKLDSHKPKHHSHYENPGSKHEEEYSSHKPKHSSHYQIPHSKHEEERISHKPQHHSHYEIPHSKHEEKYSSYKPKHHSNYETTHSRHEEPYEDSKHYHHEPHHYKDDYTP